MQTYLDFLFAFAAGSITTHLMITGHIQALLTKGRASNDSMILLTTTSPMLKPQDLKQICLSDMRIGDVYRTCISEVRIGSVCRVCIADIPDKHTGYAYWICIAYLRIRCASQICTSDAHQGSTKKSHYAEPLQASTFLFDQA